jgi:hypothetical protein
MKEVLNLINRFRKMSHPSTRTCRHIRVLAAASCQGILHSWASYERDTLPVAQDMAINMFPRQDSQNMLIALFILSVYDCAVIDVTGYELDTGV